MTKIWERQIEIGVHVLLAGNAHRGDGGTVIAHLPTNNLAPFGLADGVMVVPSKLDCGVVRFRA